MSRTKGRRARLAVLVWVAGALLACAPAATHNQQVPAVLDASEYARLEAPFRPVLDSLGVNVREGRAFRFSGPDDEALPEAAARLYRGNPGFCPLDGAFFAAPDQAVFLVLAASGTEVRGFAYDRSAPGQLTFAYLSGASRAPLKTAACRNPAR